MSADDRAVALFMEGHGKACDAVTDIVFGCEGAEDRAKAARDVLAAIAEMRDGFCTLLLAYDGEKGGGDVTR